jgi:hypothetical protein
MRAFIVAVVLMLPGTIRAQSPATSLADGRDGAIFLASSTPIGPDQYMRTPQDAPAAVRTVVWEGRSREAPPASR